MAKVHLKGDNHIQNFHLGRYIIGYMVRNHVLWLCSCINIKFPAIYPAIYIPSETFEYSCPLNNYLAFTLMVMIYYTKPKILMKSIFIVRSHTVTIIVHLLPIALHNLHNLAVTGDLQQCCMCDLQRLRPACVYTNIYKSSKYNHNSKLCYLS